MLNNKNRKLNQIFQISRRNLSLICDKFQTLPGVSLIPVLQNFGKILTYCFESATVKNNSTSLLQKKAQILVLKYYLHFYQGAHVGFKVLSSSCKPHCMFEEKENKPKLELGKKLRNMRKVRHYRETTQLCFFYKNIFVANEVKP